VTGKQAEECPGKRIRLTFQAKEFIAMFKLNVDETLSNAKLLSLRKSIAIQFGITPAHSGNPAATNAVDGGARSSPLALRRSKPYVRLVSRF
jgi:hypothetical protein